MVANYMDYSNDTCMNMIVPTRVLTCEQYLNWLDQVLLKDRMARKNAIIVVNVLLGSVTDVECVDYNGDGVVNSQDIILVVNKILS